MAPELGLEDRNSPGASAELWARAILATSAVRVEAGARENALLQVDGFCKALGAKLKDVQLKVFAAERRRGQLEPLFRRKAPEPKTGELLTFCGGSRCKVLRFCYGFFPPV